MTTMLKMALERAGFTIDTFNDPLLALKRFKPNLYDLIILDVIMEKMNGFELCNQLRKVDPLVKVCFLTASGKHIAQNLNTVRRIKMHSWTCHCH
jgi:DNA-binding response OmpR family regulator